ncbi:oxysterol-binding protein-related protein 2A-like [Hibiscus syriacus]|uniref:oxysterol-binding protein-related protein 2A-like n=1 Tax=Hibiscus syriacus TaxID=106335 RepID=UPI00192118B9|nr:oxysterol-binding protein-related protein 2A-like [Hibiscus syriacus]
MRMFISRSETGNTARLTAPPPEFSNYEKIHSPEALNLLSPTGDVILTGFALIVFGDTSSSSDDIEKQELEELSCDDETFLYDKKHAADQADNQKETDRYCGKDVCYSDSGYPQIERRKKLPDPVLKEKRVSLWSVIKDSVGKDLTRVFLPVYFNEPISSLQKYFEDLEYSKLLDQAYKYGKEGKSLQRIVNVAAFAVSGYSSTEGRDCKPFNPLLGETYEADYPERGVRFFSEKVSHHPTLIAFHCEGKGWKTWGESDLRAKFSGQSIQLNPVGVITLEFVDGEIFQWSKVTTNIYNLILDKVYCNHHGLMHIRGNRQYSCKLIFKEQSILERNRRQVHGFVEDLSGNRVATLFGKWDDSMYFINGYESGKTKDFSPSNASLLWKKNEPPPSPTRYNLTSLVFHLDLTMHTFADHVANPLYLFFI